MVRTSRPLLYSHALLYATRRVSTSHVCCFFSLVSYGSYEKRITVPSEGTRKTRPVYWAPMTLHSRINSLYGASSKPYDRVYDEGLKMNRRSKLRSEYSVGT